MKTPTYGYHAVEEPRVFDLAPGERLPAGWHDAPVQRADRVPAGVEPEPAGIPALDADDMASAAARIRELEGVIETGRAVNERLSADLDAAEDAAEATGAEMTRLKAELADAVALHGAAQEEVARLDRAEQAARAEIADLKAAAASKSGPGKPQPGTPHRGR